MSKIVFGMLCPYCKTPLTENDSIVVCSSCEMPHHLNCWQENKGCTTFGCTGTVGETFEGKDNGPLNNEVPSAVQTGNAGMLQRLHEGDKSTVWKKGAIAVDKTSLWINRELGQVYASCELRNIGEVQINAVMIEVQCKDIWGSVLDSTVAYQFLDLSVRRGDVFGHNEYIALSDKNTRNISVSIK